MPPEDIQNFNPDFAAPYEWARLIYRRLGLQVIPGWKPGEGQGSWKRPKLAEWRTFQEELVGQPVFDRWYAPNGEHASRSNMGLITGKCSRAFILDLDLHTHPEVELWWQALIEVENAGIPLETPTQRTGGGGLQMLFRYPAHWRPPTRRTDMGVDIRGEGGFAVLPPSLHETGREYTWEQGMAPWEIDILEAPDWLIHELDVLTEEYGGTESRPAAPNERTASPGSAPGRGDPGGDYTVWGMRQDGREDYMTRTVWANVVDWYRACPTYPLEHTWNERIEHAYAGYERNVVSRLGHDFEKRDALDKEGRGLKAFRGKFRAAMRRWNGKVAEEAAKPAKVGQHSFRINDEGNGNWAQSAKSENAPNAPGLDPPSAPVGGLVLSSRQFNAQFTPPDYLIDGIVQRGYLYAVTARTGDGKTAIAMYISQRVARGETVHGKEVLAGTVLFLAGENPDDIRARWRVLAEVEGFDPDELKVTWIAGVVNIPQRWPEIRRAAEEIPDLVLVVIDTAAAYFPGDEVNSNSQQGAYARLLRQFTQLPGKPAVLVNCHPVKNAAKDNLLPMGGSAFLNEIDGNLTLWAVDKKVTLYWQGKFRGPEFEPVAFELERADSPNVIDAKGRRMPSVVAKPISETALEAGEQVAEVEENRVLFALAENPRASFVTLANKCGFVVDGRPLKTKVFRIISRLVHDRMVEKYRGGRFRITAKGKKEIGWEDDADD